MSFIGTEGGVTKEIISVGSGLFWHMTKDWWLHFLS